MSGSGHAGHARHGEAAALTLITGGARSGKSRLAERLALRGPAPVLYLATATAGDDEMARRIAAHRARRPPAWQTLEVAGDPAAALETMDARAVGVILLDCLSLWVSHRLLAAVGDGEGLGPEAEASLAQELVDATVRLAQAAQRAAAAAIFVTNEVGAGVVPAYRLGRSYRDLLGLVNQEAARQAGRVVWMVAGIPQVIKGAALPDDVACG